MRRGRFEEREGASGEKYYRLTWEKQYSLSSKEVLSGLFIRYLISRGKISEFTECPQPKPIAEDSPRRAKRKRVAE